MNYNIELPILDSLEGYKHLLYVEPTSDYALKNALETIACYFRQEFRYDHLQYDKSEHPSDCIGVLFCERAMDLVKDDDHYPNRVIGAACFHKGETQPYFLDWIWFHPFARNRGRLSRDWQALQSKFNKFGFTEPLSPHMAAFLKKRTEESP